MFTLKFTLTFTNFESLVDHVQPKSVSKDGCVKMEDEKDRKSN